MNESNRASQVRRACSAAIVAVVLSTAAVACNGGPVNEAPKTSPYTEAEVFAPMEAEVAATIEALPDFPGFLGRGWNETPCYQDGDYTEDVVGVEITYVFDEVASADPLIRETYVDALRDRWTELEYDIHRDKASATGKDYSIEARREDGINLWYSVTTKTALIIQSGCVPASDPSEIQYIPPSGGIIAGGPTDANNIHGIQGYPEEPQEAAASPFEESESSSPAGMVPWNRDPGPTESGPASYEGQL